MTAESNGRFALVLVTAPDVKTARSLARAALKGRLVACANIMPKIESHYWWKGKIENGTEVMLILKTTRNCLARLQKLMLAAHPYDVPEFITLPLNGGSRQYLEWLESSVKFPVEDS